MKKHIVMTVALLGANSSFALDFGNIMALGDSMTGGTGSAPNSYRQFLDAKLTSNGHSYSWVGPRNWGVFSSGQINRHAGMGGWDLEQILNGNSNQISSGKLSDWLTAHSPDTVLFMTPVNGYWRWRFTYSSSQSVRDTAALWNETRIRQALQLIYDSNLNANVILATPPKHSAGTDFENGYNGYAANIAAVVKSVGGEFKALGRQITVIDTTDPISDQPGVHKQTDGIHFNTSGSELVSDLFYDSLDPVPEPFTLAVLATAGACVWRRRKPKR